MNVRSMVLFVLVMVLVGTVAVTACSRLFTDRDALRHNFYQNGNQVFRWNGNRLEFKSVF